VSGKYFSGTGSGERRSETVASPSEASSSSETYFFVGVEGREVESIEILGVRLGS